MQKQICKEKIRKEIARLQMTGSCITNCYTEKVMDNVEELWKSEKAILFAYSDHGVKRLVFYASDREELETVLQMPVGDEYVLDFLTKDQNENKEIFAKTGFQLLAKMMRVANPHCDSMLQELPVMAFRNDKVGYIADLSETHEINEKMWAVFDTRISHLVKDEELAEAVRRKEVCIHRNKEGEIDAFVQITVQPKKFYFNQIYNAGGRGIGHSLVLKRLCRYVQEGGQYIYAWIDERNIASLKFHEKYGMKFDGMWNMVYVR